MNKSRLGFGKVCTSVLVQDLFDQRPVAGKMD